MAWEMVARPAPLLVAVVAIATLPSVGAQSPAFVLTLQNTPGAPLEPGMEFRVGILVEQWCPVAFAGEYEVEVQIDAPSFVGSRPPPRLVWPAGVCNSPEVQAGEIHLAISKDAPRPAEAEVGVLLIAHAVGPPNTRAVGDSDAFALEVSAPSAYVGTGDEVRAARNPGPAPILSLVLLAGVVALIAATRLRR